MALVKISNTQAESSDVVADGDDRKGRARPTFGVVIPAHNEENVLARCIDALLAETAPGDVEIVVAANGCTDRTVEIARSFGDRVVVVDVAEASKHAALNAGDGVATAFPRVYLDADITVSAAAIRSVIEAMERTGALVGAPKAVIDLAGAPPVVRAFYRVWCEMPWFTDNLVGSGIYVLSAAGHARLGAFPAITNDDQYVHNLFERRERAVSPDFQFLVRPPRTMAGLITRRTRTLLGQREMDQKFGPLPGRSPRMSAIDLLRRRRVGIWDLVVYAFVARMASLAAARKQRQGDVSWERDDTSRDAALATAGRKGKF